jgi:flagellar basal body-associated protein FliL
MRDPDFDDRQEDEPKPDFLEKRGFTWAMLIVLLVLTLVAALVLVYLMTVRKLPAHG